MTSKQGSFLAKHATEEATELLSKYLEQWKIQQERTDVSTREP